MDAFARTLEATLTESVGQEDVVRAVARLVVPDLADMCGVDVIEGDRSTRCAFAHRNPKITAQVDALIDHKAPLHQFAEGRRALAGECVLLEYSGATFGQRGVRTSEMVTLLDKLRPTSGIFVPFVVLGTTIAVAGLVRAADSGLTQGRLRLRLRRFGALRFCLPTDVRPCADGLSTAGPIATFPVPRQRVVLPRAGSSHHVAGKSMAGSVQSTAMDAWRACAGVRAFSVEQPEATSSASAAATGQIPTKARITIVTASAVPPVFTRRFG